jgi:four helix bundle protein
MSANVQLPQRTKQFALRVMKLTDALPRGRSLDVIGKQLLRSATSVGANYRAACRGRSKAEFIAKLGIVEEECDETLYWFDLLIDGGLVKPGKLAPLVQEGTEILAMIVSSIRTARKSGECGVRGAK